MWCLREGAVWRCGGDDVVWTLFFTFLGRAVCGVVRWKRGGVIGRMGLCKVLVGCDVGDVI